MKGDAQRSVPFFYCILQQQKELNFFLSPCIIDFMRGFFYTKYLVFGYIVRILHYY